jgi:multiple sugar transport system permease protein
MAGLKADTARRWAVSVIRAVFLIAFAYILLYPVFYMVSTSLKGVADFIDPTVLWVPKNPVFENFKIAFTAMDYPRSLFNTLSMEMVSGALEVLVCSVFAYGLARFDFPLKKACILILVVTILVPDTMLIIPRVINFKQLDFLGVLGLLQKATGFDLRPNIVNTPFTFYLPSLLGVGLKGGIFIFIYMQFFKGLPKELEEAAWIDGAGPASTFVRIILPSSGIVILTVSVFAMIWHWNDYYLALMYTSTDRPLAVVVSQYSTYLAKSYVDMSLTGPAAQASAVAACLLFITPPLTAYLFLQRKFIQSIDRVGIVG